MNASDFHPAGEIFCNECGKKIHGHFNKQKKWVSAMKVLAGHIMASQDHENKNWAKRFLINSDVGTGLWGDKNKGW